MNLSITYWQTIYVVLFLFFIPQQESKAQNLLVEYPIELIRNDSLGFMSPKWSPNADYIAFSSSRYEGIWVASSDGKDVNRLTAESAGFGLSWSPDSKSILTRVSHYEDKKRKLSVKQFIIEDSQVLNLTETLDQLSDLPVWDVSGEHVLIPIENKIERVRSNSELQIAKQNSDSFVYLISKNDLIKVDTDGNQTILTPFKNETYLNLSVSPDRSKIAFEVYGGGLYTMDAVDLTIQELGSYQRASWAPNSQYLVAMSSKDDGYRFLESDLIVIDTDSGQIQNITLETDIIAMNPDWSPLNNAIIFDSPDTGIIYYLPIRYE